MKYFIKKMISGLFTLFVVSFFVFAAFEVIPGDAASSRLQTDATNEKLEQQREEMGLNRPFPVRYGDWVLHMLKGDLGESYRYRIPVSEMIFDKLLVNLFLAVSAFILICVCAIPLGIYTAKHEGGKVDHVLTVINQGLMSFSPLLTGLLITIVFGLILKWFTPGSYVSYQKNFGQFTAYLIYPAIAMALPKVAMTVSVLRTSILREAGQEYVRCAYSRGNSTTSVLYRHVLRNAMLPVITFLGMTFTDLIAGSILVEQIFSVPGIGRILLSSVTGRDYPVVQAVIVMIAIIVLVMNGLVDVTYHLLDPRVDSVGS